MIQGFPISAQLPEDLGFGERFWYWRGASGRSYIHSIYQLESCPPLPGAVFVLVRASDGKRQAVAAGRFPSVVESQPGNARPVIPDCRRGDEIHVHLLARDHDAAGAVLRDLEDALCGSTVEPQSWPHFAEAPQLELLEA